MQIFQFFYPDPDDILDGWLYISQAIQQFTESFYPCPRLWWLAPSSPPHLFFFKSLTIWYLRTFSICSRWLRTLAIYLCWFFVLDQSAPTVPLFFKCTLIFIGCAAAFRWAALHCFIWASIALLGVSVPSYTHSSSS